MCMICKYIYIYIYVYIYKYTHVCVCLMNAMYISVYPLTGFLPAKKGLDKLQDYLGLSIKVSCLGPLT